MTNIEAAYELAAEDLQAVEHELKKNIESSVELIPTIGSHILASGGKRFRPLILILSARACGYKGKVHISLSCVLEFIHTATLLHDDVVDNAAIRRGNSSAHTIWGNQASILVGDFFFSQAFSLIARADNWRVLTILTEASSKLAQGEILDLVKEMDAECTEEEYLSIVNYKTASLIEAASHIGAILGGADGGKEEAMRNYGYNVGIAYQYMDDTLDYVSTEEEFGKTIGKDLRDGKITLPLIYALRSSSPEDRDSLVAAIEDDSLTEKEVARVVALITKYQGLEYAGEKARYYAREAKACLRAIPDSPWKEALLTVADYAVRRRS
ncbi:MAG: polyprenyl synthetase family protein [Deltaproteobacteria bacterium]|nr:polyprenyl synthetase family protein [Deltaproteobacteria bacterium]